MSKFFQRMHSKKRGFTLIELIIVIAILGILAAILVPTMLNIVNDSRDTADLANARSAFSVAKTSYVSLAAKGDVTNEALKAAIIKDLEQTPEKDILVYFEAKDDKVTGISGVKYGEQIAGKESSYTLQIDKKA